MATRVTRLVLWVGLASTLLIGLLPARPRHGAAEAASAVNTFTGNYAYTFTDVHISGPGPSIRFTRAYNSLDTRVSSLGPGWRHSYEIRLERVGDGSGAIEVVGPQGRTDLFRRVANDYVPNPGVRNTLAENPDGTFTVTTAEQTRWILDASGGRLRAIIDRQGLQSTMRYDEHGRLAAISDPAGRGWLALEYDQATSRLAKVSDWFDPPRVVTYGYDALDRLARVTDREDNTTTFAYEGTTPGRSQLLKSITDARGHAALTIEYDSQGRVAARKDARGLATGQESRLEYFDRTGSGWITMTIHTYPPGGFDPGWNPRVVDRYDAAGRIIMRTYEPARGELYAECHKYDGWWNRIAVTDCAERPITQRPDTFWREASCDFDVDGAIGEGTGLGPLLHRLDDLLGSLNRGGAGEAAGPGAGVMADMPWQTNTAEGSASSYEHEYDAVGRVIRIDTSVDAPVADADTNGTGRGKRTRRFQYDNEDRLRFIEESPPRPESPPLVTEFRYDAVGNRTIVIDPDGQVTRYVYDERDSLTEVHWSTEQWTDPDVAPHSKHVRTYTYDDRGNTERATLFRPDGSEVAEMEFAYDGFFRLRRAIEYRPGRLLPRVTTFEYDAEGRCVDDAGNLAWTSLVDDVLVSLEQLARPLRMAQAAGAVLLAVLLLGALLVRRLRH